MEIINSLIDFFGINQISESITFIDLLSSVVKLGFAVWIVCFVFRCLFVVIDLPNRRMW